VFGGGIGSAKRERREASSAQTQSEGTPRRTKPAARDRFGRMAGRRPDESSVGV
jgi:hypothetical protein